MAKKVPKLKRIERGSRNVLMFRNEKRPMASYAQFYYERGITQDKVDTKSVNAAFLLNIARSCRCSYFPVFVSNSRSFFKRLSPDTRPLKENSFHYYHGALSKTVCSVCRVVLRSLSLCSA